ncbi:MAG: DnaA N-terminal domain-containing protein, partial [Pseudomonadota bacterium]
MADSGEAAERVAPCTNDKGDEKLAGGDVFAKVCKQLRAKLGAEVYQSWFGRLKLVESDEHAVTLSVPTPFLRNWINSHYLTTITELWQAEVSTVLRVNVIVRSAVRAQAPGYRDQAAK